MKKNILKKSKKVLFAIAATVVIGISPLKAQWWEEVLFMKKKLTFRIEFDSTEACETIVNLYFTTNRHGFYFNKTKYFRKMGSALDLN